MKSEEVNESEERYIKEYQMMIKDYARMAANYPDMTDQLRTALKASAAMMISNSPEAISEFRKLAEDVDAFLHACQTGEIDPCTLLQRMDKET
ncbi:MAG: hypothetical protein HQK60_16035 [Deltaproteobacteria bacterium]|nr:hypothetical protein [Deltaproteobacteria bacterium]